MIFVKRLDKEPHNAECVGNPRKQAFHENFIKVFFPEVVKQGIDEFCGENLVILGIIKSSYEIDEIFAICKQPAQV
jgi:hypothetical protein